MARRFLLDERGASDFGALQRAPGGRSGKSAAGNTVLYAFDLVYLDGLDLRSMSLDERRNMLADVVKPNSPLIISEELDADGAEFLKLACTMRLEGVIAKRRDAPYNSGRSGDWLKIKCFQSVTFQPRWNAARQSRPKAFTFSVVHRECPSQALQSSRQGRKSARARLKVRVIINAIADSRREGTRQPFIC